LTGVKAGAIPSPYLVQIDGGRRALRPCNVARKGLALSAAAVATVLLGFAPSAAHAADKGLEDKGEVLLQENCSRCHAIGKQGESPHKDAPPFRTLSRSYPVEDLAESLAEGIVSGHPEMPIFVFNAHDVEAIIQYLDSIQEQ
jgi:cytochrome c